MAERAAPARCRVDKAETAAKHGEEQTKIWRRSYDIPPPALRIDDPRHPSHDPRYRSLDPKDLPSTECLKDTVARFLPLWRDEIAPAIRRGERVLIAAHGNSLRALVKYLDGISDADIVELNIPTGIPLVYELDANLKPIKSRYLGDPDAAKAAERVVRRPRRSRRQVAARDATEHREHRALFSTPRTKAIEDHRSRSWAFLSKASPRSRAPWRFVRGGSRGHQELLQLPVRHRVGRDPTVAFANTARTRNVIPPRSAAHPAYRQLPAARARCEVLQGVAEK